jgi:hypothetical protein
VFGEAVRMIGDALGIEFDEVRCDAEYAKTTEDLDLGSWTIPAGGVAGVFISWKGIFEATTLEEFMVLGHIMTAMPAINAIPAVVAAPPGIVTYNDLPLIVPKGVVPQG